MNDFTLLLVDDNDDDLFALQRAIKRAAITNPVQVLTNGEQAIAYLAGTQRFADRKAFPLPGLVFLDLKMPIRDGFEVLEWVRSNGGMPGTAFVVLSGSDQARDHRRAYELGARSYLVKPPKPEDLRALFESLSSFWAGARATGALAR